ncbi:hypothetical protein RUND412_001175 [Rhizina undulata]
MSSSFTLEQPKVIKSTMTSTSTAKSPSSLMPPPPLPARLQKKPIGNDGVTTKELAWWVNSVPPAADDQNSSPKGKAVERRGFFSKAPPKPASAALVNKALENSRDANKQFLKSAPPSAKPLLVESSTSGHKSAEVSKEKDQTSSPAPQAQLLSPRRRDRNSSHKPPHVPSKRVIKIREAVLAQMNGRIKIDEATKHYFIPPLLVPTIAEELDSDYEATLNYSNLITKIEDTILFLAHRPYDNLSKMLITFAELGTLLKNIEMVWEDVKANYSDLWPKGRQQAAFIKVEYSFKVWFKNFRKSQRIIPVTKPILPDYDTSGATMAEILALMEYKELIGDAKDLVVSMVKKVNFTKQDEIKVRLKAFDIFKMKHCWDDCMIRYGRWRPASAFIVGTDMAYREYEKSIRKEYEELGGDAAWMSDEEDGGCRLNTSDSGHDDGEKGKAD